MEYRTLGKSGLQVSRVSFGAGPLAGLMVGSHQEAQRRVIARSLQANINWFDTAASYGHGDSESALGAALRACQRPEDLCIATKVRLAADQLDNIPKAIRQSLEGSLQRLGVDRVTLLQLHNSVTSRRGDLPTSIDVQDVLGKEGVLSALEQLRREGRVEHFGFTGLGDKRSLAELVSSGAFTSAQIPLNLLLPFSGRDRWAGSVDVDYERLAEDCSAGGIGVIAIRVFAGGALVGQDPSPHTYQTKFFTLDLFQRDRLRAEKLKQALPAGLTPAEAALRFVLHKPEVTTALIGFGQPEQLDAAMKFAAKGPLDESVLKRIDALDGPGRDTSDCPG
ncbi:MAG: hypothetical protein CMJ81_23885 [Planctomycetaceae bacterium]|nr:hypothetical protein [Planctomycetaceae bacterium]MBP60939.1 hypothetical protein [Planctomycetaceae bacterium]